MVARARRCAQFVGVLEIIIGLAANISGCYHVCPRYAATTKIVSMLFFHFGFLLVVLVFQSGHTWIRWLRQFAESSAQEIGEEGLRVHTDGGG